MVRMATLPCQTRALERAARQEEKEKPNNLSIFSSIGVGPMTKSLFSTIYLLKIEFSLQSIQFVMSFMFQIYFRGILREI